MSAKINVLDRFKEVVDGIRTGRIDITGSMALRAFDMAQRHIENLEKNQGFGAQKRADIAAQLMASNFTGFDMATAAKTAVKGADALLTELNRPPETMLYTHKTKAGTYEILGVSTGAGTSRGQTMVCYRDVNTLKLYHRTEIDFKEMMEILE